MTLCKVPRFRGKALRLGGGGEGPSDYFFWTLKHEEHGPKKQHSSRPGPERMPLRVESQAGGDGADLDRYGGRGWEPGQTLRNPLLRPDHPAPPGLGAECYQLTSADPARSSREGPQPGGGEESRRGTSPRLRGQRRGAGGGQGQGSAWTCPRLRLGKFTNPTSKWNVLAPQEGIWGFLAPAQGSRRTKVRGPQDPDAPLP